jgi:hypothetical protein
MDVTLLENKDVLIRNILFSVNFIVHGNGVYPNDREIYKTTNEYGHLTFRFDGVDYIVDRQGDFKDFLVSLSNKYEISLNLFNDTSYRRVHMGKNYIIPNTIYIYASEETYDKHRVEERDNLIDQILK